MVLPLEALELHVCVRCTLFTCLAPSRYPSFRSLASQHTTPPPRDRSDTGHSARCVASISSHTVPLPVYDMRDETCSVSSEGYGRCPVAPGPADELSAAGAASGRGEFDASEVLARPGAGTVSRHKIIRALAMPGMRDAVRLECHEREP